MQQKNKTGSVGQFSIRTLMMFSVMVAACFPLITWCRESESWGAKDLPVFLGASLGPAILGLALAPVAGVASLIGIVVLSVRDKCFSYLAIGLVGFSVVTPMTLLLLPVQSPTDGLDVFARMVLVMACVVACVFMESVIRKSIWHRRSSICLSVTATISAYVFWWACLVTASV